MHHYSGRPAQAAAQTEELARLGRIERGDVPYRDLFCASARCRSPRPASYYHDE